MDFTLRSDDDLKQEAQWILQQDAMVVEEVITGQCEGERYAALHEEHTRLYDMFMEIHREMQRRGR